MKLFKNILLGLTVLTSSALSFGQLDRSVVPSSGPAPEIHIPNSDVFTLENGLTVILSENHKIPNVSFNLVMGSDSRLEGEKTGLANITGELILSGTTNRTKDELDNEKDFIGASLSASSDNIFMSTLTKHLDKALDLMTDVMQNANFPESEFERIVKQVESSLYANKTDASQIANNVRNKIIFGDKHPFGEITTEETLKNITREDVIAFYKKQFTPSGSYLIIVGDIDLEKAKEIANIRFGNWEGTVPFEKQYEMPVLPKGKRVIFVEKPGAVQSVISVTFPINIKPGDKNQIKLTTANRIFGGSGFGTRLMQNLREDKAFTYGAYSRLNIDREGSYLSATGNFRNEVTDSAIVEFLYEIDRITKDVVTDEELSLNKAALNGGFARDLESPRTIANFALNTLRNNLPKDYYQTYLQKLSAVNKDDILAMAKEYFQPENLNIIVVGNKDVIEKIRPFATNGEVEILDVYGKPAIEKEYAKADITKEQVLENYLMAVTKTTDMKKATKKINKIKSITKNMGATPSGSPMELKLTEYFMAPNKTASKLEVQGMTIQQEIFDGEKGMTKAMNQTGSFEVKELDEDEINEKKKISAVFEEYAVACCNPDIIELLGVDSKDGKEYYVIQYNLGKTTKTAYYNKKTSLLDYSDVLVITEDGPQSFSDVYSDYTDYKGYLFPNTTARMIESITLNVKVKSIDINKKIDSKIFKMD